MSLRSIYYIVNRQNGIFCAVCVAQGSAEMDCNSRLTTCQFPISCNAKFFYLPGGGILTLGLKLFNSKGKNFIGCVKNLTWCQKIDEVEDYACLLGQGPKER